jgi:predicted transcriptional regulator
MKEQTNTHHLIYSLLSDTTGMTITQLTHHLNQTEIDLTIILRHLETQGVLQKKYLNGEWWYSLKKTKRGKINKRKQKTLAIRQKIVLLLLENPGLNLTSIAEQLSLSPQLTEYHLLYLCRNNKIMSIKGKKGYFRRFYIKESGVGKIDKDVIAVLRQPNLLRVVLMIMKHPTLSHQELADQLHLHPSTLTHHISRLAEYDLVESVHRGKEKVYQVKQRRKIMGIVRKYIYNVITDGFRDMWEEMDPRV